MVIVIVVDVYCCDRQAPVGRTSPPSSPLHPRFAFRNPQVQGPRRTPTNPTPAFRLSFRRPDFVHNPYGGAKHLIADLTRTAATRIPVTRYTRRRCGSADRPANTNRCRHSHGRPVPSLQRPLIAVCAASLGTRSRSGSRAGVSWV